MNERMMIFMAVLMVSAGTLAQDTGPQVSPHGQPNAEHSAKIPALHFGDVPGHAKRTGERPSLETVPEHRGGMETNMDPTQLGMSVFLEVDTSRDGIIDEAEENAAKTKLVMLFRQQIKKHNALMTRRFDKDGDGVLDDQEKALMRETMTKFCSSLPTKAENFNDMYHRIDKDGNGRISQEEMQHFIVELQKRELLIAVKEFDKNGNGKLEDDELAMAAAAIIKRYDRNKNGQLDRQELRLLWQDISEQGKALRNGQSRKPLEDPKDR